ncbi:MAG: amidohydrolase family protein [Verrucomicrobiales bacterium]|nr:amidohydrolase family protein [Verrucomicrobiales bacterium]
MIASKTVLGLTEIRAVRATRDMIESGDINPNVRAEVTVNPDSELLPVTRSNGVLHVLSVPQSNGLIAGQSALMKLDGWTWEEMTVKSSVGMHLRWPNVPDPGRALNAKQKKALKEAYDKTKLQLNRLEESFNRARAYLKARNVGNLLQKTDLRWEAMKGVLSGSVPIYVHVNRLFEIQEAVKFAIEQKVKIVIVGGSDAWRAIPLLKKHNVPVIISPVNSLPGRRWEDYDTPMVNPVKLQRAGVRFCITGRGRSMDAPHERNLPYQAARAAAFGLPKEEALKSVTLYPAQILGVDDRLGSLEEGKDATFIITTGDPLEVTTKIFDAYIGGRPIDMSNKQTRLYEKYKKKYLQKNRG